MCCFSVAKKIGGVFGSSSDDDDLFTTSISKSVSKSTPAPKKELSESDKKVLRYSTTHTQFSLSQLFTQHAFRNFLKFLLRVHNNKSRRVSYSVIACTNTSYYAIPIVTFEVLSDHMMVLKDIDFYYCKESAIMEPFNIRLDRRDTEITSLTICCFSAHIEPSSFAQDSK